MMIFLDKNEKEKKMNRKLHRYKLYRYIYFVEIMNQKPIKQKCVGISLTYSNEES